jgi:hypothetical protein
MIPSCIPDEVTQVDPVLVTISEGVTQFSA